MISQKLTSRIASIVLDLGNSELLRQAGWRKSTVFSWCINYAEPEKPFVALTSERKKEDILAAAPTTSELLSAVPSQYEGLHIRINKWQKKGKAAEEEYGVSYCTDDGTAEFLTEGSTLEAAHASMWNWMHSDDPPHKDS